MNADDCKHWKLSIDSDQIAWLLIDREGESTNTLSQDVITEFDGILDKLAANPPRGLVVMSGKESGFIAGADIREFEGFDNAAEVTELVKQGHAVFAKLENLKCPTVAAVSGFCVGGGYELALCCDYIMVLDVPDTRVGLPEIQLGIVPGLGGTCLLYTSPSPRDATLSRMPSSA